MKKIFTLLFTFLAFADLCAQYNIIRLKNIPFSIPGQDFYIKEVIDGRKDKNNIGFVQVGLFNKKKDAYFEGGLEKQLNEYFRNSQSADSLYKPVILRVAYLNIYEKTTFKELGRVDLQVEFYEYEGEGLRKVFEAEAYAEDLSAADVTGGHERRIRLALIECLKKFAKAKAEERGQESDIIPLSELQEKSSDIEKTALSIDTAVINAPWADVVNLQISAGLYTSGVHAQYLGYGDTIQVGKWFVPVSYSFSNYVLKPGAIEGSGFDAMNSVTFGFLIPGMWKIGERFHLSLQGGMGFGFESLHRNDQPDKVRPVLDGVANQFIIFIPKDKFGLVLGLGPYEYFITSQVHMWDVGVKFLIGLKF